MKKIVLEKEELEYASVYTSLTPKTTYAYTSEELREMIQWEKKDAVDTMNATVYWKDLDGFILGCNQYMVELFGFKNEAEIIGKTNYDLTSKDLADQIEAIDKEVIRTERRMQFRETVSINGRRYVFLTSKEPLRDRQNKIIGVKGCSIDMTELYLAEQKALNSGVTAGTVAHDLKNMIHLLGLHAEKAAWHLDQLKAEKILEKSSLTQQAIDFLYIYPKSNLELGKKMSQTVDASLMRLQEVIVGNMAAVAEDFEIYSIFPILESTLASYAHHRDKPFIYLNNIENFEFFGNNHLIEKIVSNLFNNALRQMNQYKQGEIFLSTVKNEHFNILKIKDTAGYVTQDRIDELFIAYKTGNVSGTGFGLSSAKLFMERIGGSIQARLVEGDKIEFELYFPKLDDTNLATK